MAPEHRHHISQARRAGLGSTGGSASQPDVEWIIHIRDFGGRNEEAAKGDEGTVCLYVCFFLLFVCIDDAR